MSAARPFAASEFPLVPARDFRISAIGSAPGRASSGGLEMLDLRDGRSAGRISAMRVEWERDCLLGLRLAPTLATSFSSAAWSFSGAISSAKPAAGLISQMHITYEAMATDGSPRSMRAMVGCETPSFLAHCACDSPRRLRAMTMFSASCSICLSTACG